MEEYDPIERMKRLASQGANSGASTTSLKEELQQLQGEVDIHNFTYKPVPRTDDEDEE